MNNSVWFAKRNLTKYDRWKMSLRETKSTMMGNQLKGNDIKKIEGSNHIGI